MKNAQILLTTSILMVGTFGSWANQTIPLNSGIPQNFVTCQAANSGGNDINNAAFLQGENEGDVIRFWDCSSQSYTEIYEYFVGFGWFDQNSDFAVRVWSPGEGAFYQTASPAVLTFVGSTPGTTTYTTPSSGICLRGSPTPNPINGTYVVPEDIIAAPVNGDLIYVSNLPGGVSDPIHHPEYSTFYYFDSNQGGWVPRTGTTPPYSPHISPVYRSAFVGKLASAVIEGDVRKTATSSCASPTTPLANWKVKASYTSGPDTYKYFGLSDANGHYAIIAPPGHTYTVNSASPPDGWSQCVPTAAYSVPTLPDTFYPARDFTEKTTVTGPDLTVDLVSFFPYPLRSPCCGQNMTYVISYRNAGTDPLTGVQVKLTFPAAQTLVSDTSDPVIPTGVGLAPRIWTIPGTLNPLQSGNIQFTVKLPASPCTGPITAKAKGVFPNWLLDDVLPNDNIVKAFPQNITCSHDPNDLQVSPQGCGAEGFISLGQPLTYLIRFQNTGTGPAYQVVVSNALNANLDVSTLQVIGSSHPNVLEVQGNQLVWTFPNIYLPPQSVNDLGSQGYVKYQVWPFAAAPVGAVITNGAAIYFDLNAPVLTVTTTNTITASPVPVASFSVTPAVGSGGHTNSFTYTGGTTGATFLWDFGPDATPSTSTAQDPTDVVFATEGDKLVSLQVSLGGCQSDPAVQILRVGVPSLTVEWIGGQLVLSWEGAGFHLQEKSDLQPATSWTASSATITQIESSYAATPTIDSVAKFYRLSQVAP